MAHFHSTHSSGFVMIALKKDPSQNPKNASRMQRAVVRRVVPYAAANAEEEGGAE